MGGVRYLLVHKMSVGYDIHWDTGFTLTLASRQQAKGQRYYLSQNIGPGLPDLLHRPCFGLLLQSATYTFLTWKVSSPICWDFYDSDTVRMFYLRTEALS